MGAAARKQDARALPARRLRGCPGYPGGNGFLDIGYNHRAGHPAGQSRRAPRGIR